MQIRRFGERDLIAHDRVLPLGLDKEIGVTTDAG